jgi:hypothetical protein
MLVATALPFVGAPAYLLAGGSPLPRRLRLAVTVVGPLIALVLLAGGAVVGGLV